MKNFREKLKAAIDGEVMMLEADVVLGLDLNNLDKGQMPVMAHPPDILSDLTLKEFLEGVIKV